jgi:8-oxo-dGTP pyrophosphatase MutT (NUDIX family)
MMLPAATARYASTVALLRPSDEKRFEVLLTRRPQQMRFMGGFYVFPGGTVHQEDYADQILKRCRSLNSADAQRILGDSLNAEVSLGHWVAAIRELFEEVGVLLCQTSDGADVDVGAELKQERFERGRKALVESKLDFGAFLEAENLYCDLSRLVYCFRRVTPQIYPMRFDTRFYFALLPPAQAALERSEEVAETLWLTPGEALERTYNDGFPLLPPTSTVLEELAQISTWQKLQAKYGLG